MPRPRSGRTQREEILTSGVPVSMKKKTPFFNGVFYRGGGRRPFLGVASLEEIVSCLFSGFRFLRFPISLELSIELSFDIAPTVPQVDYFVTI